MDESAKMNDGSGQIGPISFALTAADVPTFVVNIGGTQTRSYQFSNGVIQLPSNNHGVSQSDYANFYYLFNSPVSSNPANTFIYFRAASDWRNWEATLPASNGFSDATAQQFFSTQRDKIASKLTSLQQQLVQRYIDFLVVRMRLSVSA